EIDGHDHAQCLDALRLAKEHKGAPTAIVSHTIKGKGVSFMELDYNWHGKAPNAEQAARAIQEIQAAR
ncbi:MAG: transketolase, partial [Actinomycetota bacterium]